VLGGFHFLPKAKRVIYLFQSGGPSQLDLYDHKDHNAHQMAVALRRHRAQIEALKQQRADLDAAIETAEQACAVMEARLGEHRPDLLPGAEEYASLLKARLNPDPTHDAHLSRLHPLKARV
jgi:ABC-type transporter Mla subunit MlaD